MDWKIPAPGLAALGLTLLLTGPARGQDAAAPPGTEPVVFGFNPVDGSTWRKTMVDREHKDYGELGPPHEQVTEGEVLVTYRQLEQGWKVIRVPQSASMMVNGEVIHNPALGQVIGFENSLDVNRLGAAVSAHGFAEFVKRLEKVLDPEQYARYREGNSGERLAATEVHIWNTFYSELLGYEIRPGEVWRVMDGVNIGPGGRTQVMGTITFDGWTEISGERGFKVTYRYDSSGEIMAAAESNHTRSITRVPDEQFTPNNAVIQGTWVRVIQPSTGQLLYSVKDQTMELPLNPTDLTKKGVFTRHHTHRWTRVDS